MGDAWAAYQLDVAVLTVGASVEAALTDGKSIDEIFAKQPISAPSSSPRANTTRYRDPTPLISERIAIPPSGIW